MAAEKNNLVDALHRLWVIFLEGLHQRIELFAMEFGEEKRRFIGLLVAVLVATMAVFFGFFMLNLALLLLFWKFNIWLAFGFTGFYLLLAAVIALRIRIKMKNSPKPFAASMEEFKNDQEFFGSKK